ncbi:MAG: hypothetical protein AMJ81_05710 [Phycisphaerae bacterium SM23_33]|nr:MAG: hypothetical protein AMJ81_05710 [Phycisphaerae bacterium SM23_33]
MAYYAGGYATVPPIVHLRSGESLRRYLKPGLEDGKTFVYWGINYNTAGIPGPERSRSWVNQPQNMYRAKRDCGHKPGQARYANAMYTYTPDFTSGKYKEGVIDESDKQVTFEFYTPYVIAAAPPPEAAKEQWGIYKSGCTGGLVIQGSMTCPVEVSTDRGKTWQQAGAAKDGMDLTDVVKGHSQYWIRFGAAAKELADAGLSIRTVCQCAPALIPHLKGGKNTVTFAASGKAVISAGPNLDQAHVVAGKIASPSVTLQLAAPRRAAAIHVYAASRQASGAPPGDCLYNIDCSADGGKTWKPVLKDWKIIRHKPEPKDWWSHSFCYGDAALPGVAGPVRVRFTNTGGRAFTRPEAHLVYEVRNTSPVKVTFAWKEDGAVKTAAHTYEAPSGKADTSWSFDAGAKPETLWVEYAAD